MYIAIYKVLYMYCRVSLLGLVAMAVMATILVWVQAMHHANLKVMPLMYDLYVEFCGYVTTLCFYHEMHMLLLLDMPTGMPGPSMGS